jgi:2-oxoglutarate ferredoxin oxidoreductase subunit alpha
LPLEPGKYFWQGNRACVEGALAAGCRLFAGYPITPATEISELMSERLPEVDGVFVQGEDELASLGIVVGASIAGWKAMTATSGPGISLMQENIGYAAMTETPCVLVDAMRVGGATGIATKPMQGDVYQVRYGSHGDYAPIVLAPNSPQEMFDLTIEAFNLAETYRCPVFVLSDEIISHMRENVVVPDPAEIRIVDRRCPESPEELAADDAYFTDAGVPLMPAVGDGYALRISGFVRSETGSPTTDYAKTEQFLSRLWNKVESRVNEISRIETTATEDADTVIVAYGSVARSADRAAKMLRAEGLKVGFVRLVTLWPFADEKLRHACETADKVLVPEMNMGKLVREVERALQGRAEVRSFPKSGVDLHRPTEIAERVRRLRA